MNTNNLKETLPDDIDLKQLASIETPDHELCCRDPGKIAEQDVVEYRKIRCDMIVRLVLD